MSFKAFGFDVVKADLNQMLFDFQKDIVHWALQKGKTAIFADCGLGKTPMQLEWARHVTKKTDGMVLILAPLAVSQQTKREGDKFGIPVNVCREPEDLKTGINITNYERLEHFAGIEFAGVVLDESSILKSYSGKTKQEIIRRFKDTSYKLACTATPSPNDHMEILNHAAFLDVMHSHEALAIWFINDTNNIGTYRLKKHAEKDFWQWVSSWAVSLSKPSDLGYDDDGFILPPLNVIEKIIQVDPTTNAPEGMLFRIPEMNATAFHKEKRLTADGRSVATKALIEQMGDESVMVWCDTNYEADSLLKALNGIGAVEVRGNDSNQKKEQSAVDFINGDIQVLVSKPSIFGFGLNFQHCRNVIFCGLSYSFESFYQATRRFWRFGQTKEVNVYVVIGDTEKNIIDVIKRKENLFAELKANMQKEMSEFCEITTSKEYRMDYDKNEVNGQRYTLILGDSTEEIKHLQSDTVGLSIFSPPFSNLYIYSDSYRDLGNTRDDGEFFKHFEYIIPEIYRITIPGRVCAVHCKQLVNYKHRDGASGLRDFRGDIIRAFLRHGWTYHSEVTIWKDPVIEMQRTKAHGLLYKQLRKDSSYSRQGMAEYLVIFRKWAEDYIDPEPIQKTKEDFPLDRWQEWASPIWTTINQTNVLNARIARGSCDEKHICPLQLDIIERAIILWSNSGDLIFSPFAGVGSEGYMALKLGRRFIGIELKADYFKYARKFLDEAENIGQINLFGAVHDDLGMVPTVDADEPRQEAPGK